MRKIVIAAIVIFIAAVPTVFAAGADCPPRFAYSGPNGPENWPRLDIPNNQCGAGDQSPVNIANWRPGTGTIVSVSYEDVIAGVENTGVGVKVKPFGASFISLEGLPPLYLTQFHFHTPSEHTVNGHQYPGELHLVHEVEGVAVVIALLVSVDKPNALVASILRVLPNEICKSGTTQGALKLSELLPKEIRSYYTYTGSLTTPPCSRHVTFIMPTNVPFTVSQEEYDALAKLGPNARPLQPIQGRTIQLIRR